MVGVYISLYLWKERILHDFINTLLHRCFNIQPLFFIESFVFFHADMAPYDIYTCHLILLSWISSTWSLHPVITTFPANIHERTLVLYICLTWSSSTFNNSKGTRVPRVEATKCVTSSTAHHFPRFKTTYFQGSVLKFPLLQKLWTTEI